MPFEEQGKRSGLTGKRLAAASPAGINASYVRLPAILKKFRRAFPDVELLVETGNTPVLLEGLNRGTLDLALVVSADLVEKRDYCVELTWDFEMVLTRSAAILRFQLYVRDFSGIVTRVLTGRDQAASANK